MGHLLLALLVSIALQDHEGDAQAITSVVEAQSGAAIADGRYSQRVEGKVLHIEARTTSPTAARSSSAPPSA